MWQSRVVMVVLAGLAAGGCARPKTLEFAPLPPIVSRTPLTITGIVVKDDKGNVLDPPPTLEVSSAPADGFFIDGLALTPKKSGTFQLTVKVKDSAVSASRSVEVTLVDRVDVGCVDSKDCVVGTGKTLQLQVTAMSSGTPVAGVTPKVDVPDVSVLKPTGPLQFLAGIPGKVTVQVTAGDVAVSREITVVDLPERVTLRCPKGSEAHDATPDKPRCTIMQGKSIQLERDVIKDGKPFKAATTLEWTSADGRVASVDQGGLVEARAMGLTRVSLKVNGVEGSLEIGVVGDPEVSVRMGATCSGSNPHKVPMALAGGGARARTVVFRCETRGGVACLKRTLQGPVSPEDMASAEETCCCNH
jgi:hypothetical protein